MDEAAVATTGLTNHDGCVGSLDSLDLEVRQGENFGFLRREKAKYGPVGAQSTIKVVAVISVARVLKGAAVHE